MAETKTENAKKEYKTKKLKLIQSVQTFSPILDIKRGIIITKDNRFVKLMEFSPINFSLFSPSEQDNIISSFSSALKIMPTNLQFKVVSRKVDVSKLLEILAGHYQSEKNERCRTLQMEQMNLIESIGMEQGVSRHFFLAFEYEQGSGYEIRKKPTFEQIVSSLEATAASIKNAMEACGNECISRDGDDDYILEMLYMIMSKGQSEVESYKEHEFNVLARYAQQSAVNTSKEYDLPVNDFICPAMIDTKTSPQYIVVKGNNGAPDIYYTFAYIPSGAYPKACVAGWMNILINIGEGVDTDIYIHKEPTETAVRKLQYSLRYNKMRIKEGDDTDSGYDELLETLNSGYYLKQGLASNEDFCYFGCMLTITAHSLDELNMRFSEIKKHLTRRDLSCKKASFQMLEAFKMSLPILDISKGIFKKSKRNILTSGLGSTYPFVSYEMSDENGVLLGTQENGSLVLLDNFDSSKYSNANMCIMGSSGSGKTYLLQCMALRFREKRTQVFIIAPDKGHEFKRACEAIGGQFITIAPGSGQNINIMEIRKMDERTTVLLDGEGFASGSILASKIQNLHAFFSLLIPDITPDERQLLDEALVRTYQRFKITANNDSLEDPSNPGKYRKMPILGDLHNELKKSGDSARRICNILNRYVSGSAASFNQPTNVNLDNKYVVLDVSKLTKELLPIGMFIALDYVWDKAREDRTSQKIIFMDEGWKLIGPSASEEAAEFAMEVFKVIRGYGGSAVIATQDLNDFLTLNDGKFGKAIINSSKIKIIMKVEKTEADTIAESLDLTSAEIERLTRMKRGNGLLVANANHVFIEVKASQTEHKLITTDRKDLEGLASSIKEASHNPEDNL